MTDPVVAAQATPAPAQPAATPVSLVPADPRACYDADMIKTNLDLISHLQREIMKFSFLIADAQDNIKAAQARLDAKGVQTVKGALMQVASVLLLFMLLPFLGGCIPLKSFADGAASQVAPAAPAPVVLPPPVPGETAGQRALEIAAATLQALNQAKQAPVPPKDDNTLFYTLGAGLSALLLGGVGFLTHGAITGNTIKAIAGPLVATIQKQSDQLNDSVPAATHDQAVAGLANSTPTTVTTTAAAG